MRPKTKLIHAGIVGDETTGAVSTRERYLSQNVYDLLKEDE